MSRFQKWLLWVSSLVTAATGLGYGWMKYLLEPSEPWAVINHPLEPWLLKAHIVTAPVLVFAFGLIAVDHVWKHFRCRVPLGRRSGLAAGLFFGPMVLTGYAIQVVTSAGWLGALVWAHLATGAVYVVGLVLHQKVFRGRSRTLKERRREAEATRRTLVRPVPPKARPRPSERRAPGAGVETDPGGRAGATGGGGRGTSHHAR